MDRAILVGVLFLVGVSPTITYRYPYNRMSHPPYPPRAWNRYSESTTSSPESSCDIKWLEMTHCAVEITCTDISDMEPHHLKAELSNPNWICFIIDDKEENKNIYNKTHNINLKIIGNIPEDLNLFKSDDYNDYRLQIKNIAFINNPISSVPEELNMLTALEGIEIIDYNIEVFNVTKFMEFEDLTNLNMSHNLITDIVFNNSTNIPTDFRKLQILDLSYNQIENLDNFSNLEFAELTYLDLSYNKIKHFVAFPKSGFKKLQHLYLSHNQILEVGNYIKQLSNIRKLTFDFNQITAIEAIHFAGLDKIETLNFSTNAIQLINEQAFDSLVILRELDLSNNEITIIQKPLFKHNSELHSLSLKNNSIETVALEAFSDKNFTKFDIDHNLLRGPIDQIFQAPYVENLDLSGMLITSIGPLAFNNAVVNLNLSHNNIDSIAPSAFSESKSVNILDLSHNRLRKLNFNFSSMPELSSLYLQNNNIEVLFQTTLKNLTSLTELNLSENRPINLIESKSFKDLQKLEKLFLNNSPQLRGFKNGTFDGLSNLSYLDFASSGITVLQNELFSDLKQLEFLNASHCQIEKIELNVFKNLDSIEWIDLSYNSLSEFSVHNNDIFQIRKLYLSFNKIKNISENTFKGLHLLLLLDLANNNIVQIGNSAFNSLKKLDVLNLSSNKDIEINSNTFSNSSIESLILRNSSNNLNFEHTINTKITFLDLSSCEIDDIDSIYIYNLDIEDLRLNSNQIKKIGKHSFSNMTSLKFLDVSSNAISYIQPGTFLHLVNLETLNLHDNDIDKFELGAFEGLKNLRLLNLSNNEITSFKHLYVRNLPALEKVSLDNNQINDISFATNVVSKARFTVGGNKIPCHQLTRYTYLLLTRISSEILNYHSENVDGITCYNVDINNNDDPAHSALNATYTLANAIEKLQETIKNTVTHIIGADKDSSAKFIDNSQNMHSDIKSLVNLTVTCLVFLVVICLIIFMPKVISNIKLLPRYRRQHSGIPLLNTREEIE